MVPGFLSMAIGVGNFMLHIKKDKT